MTFKVHLIDMVSGGRVVRSPDLRPRVWIPPVVTMYQRQLSVPSLRSGVG